MDVGGKGVRSDINVTPLADVVLVLLIVFMVVTPLLQRGKPVALPDARLVSALGSGGDPILLTLTRDGRLWIDQREVKSRGDLAPALQDEMARLPAAPILFKADRDLPYKTIREVMLEISRTRVPGVSLAAAELKEAP